MKNLIGMPISNEKDKIMNDFASKIDELCHDLSYHPYASFIDVVLDLLIVYKENFRICAVRYAPDKSHLIYEKGRMPLILKGAVIPIGVVVDKNWNCYICSNKSKKARKMSINDLAKLINDTFSSISLQPDKEKIKSELLRIFNKSRFKNKKQCEEIFEKACNELEFNNGVVSMKENNEIDFFSAMLGRITKPNKICRYTSLDSLFTMLNDNKITMCTPVSMNDSREGEYADSMTPSYVNIGKNDSVIELDNSVFMLSCSDMNVYDNLTLWRLYGDNAKGVCVSFHIDDSKIDNKKYFLAPVNYGNNKKHPELEFIRDILKVQLDNGWHFKFYKWHFWKYFFKPYEYAVENEVRLLYIPFAEHELLMTTWFKDRANGIFSKKIDVPIDDENKLEFPLSIDSVILGPNSPHSNVNGEQIWYMSNHSSVKSTNGYINVNKSIIKNYR